MTAFPTPGVTPPNWGQQLIDAVTSRAPGAELGFSQVTSAFTTTNTNPASVAAASLITGLSVTVVGNGTPVAIKFYAPSVWHSVANASVSGYIVVNGVALVANVGQVNSPSTAAGPALTIHDRLVLVASTSYTFQVGVAGGVAGTSTVTAAVNFAKVQLQVVGL